MRKIEEQMMTMESTNQPNSALEAENHEKHGASSKSHTSRGNFLNLIV